MKAKRKAFMIVDALAGLMLLSALAGVLLVCVSSSQLAAERLADQRTALHAAQQALVQLQSHEKISIDDPSVHISVVRTDLRVGNYQWVQCTAVCEDRHASLVGLAPIMPEEK